jgi:V-type H+-transporting ATPase subunit a
MERILRFLTSEISAVDGCVITKNCVDEFLSGDEEYQLDAVEAELQSINKQFVEFKENNSVLLQEKRLAMEEIQVIGRAKTLLVGSKSSAQGGLTEPLTAGEDMIERRLSSVAGVVPTKEEQKLRLALFRASRGNAFADFFEIENPLPDPKTGELVKKSVFVVYFQGSGGVSAPLHQKVMKVCQAMGVGIYSWPADAKEASTRHAVLEKSLREKERALEGFKGFMQMEMEQLTAVSRPGANSKIEDWRLFCIKEKSIYTVLNLCKGDMALMVNVWYPTADQQKIEDLLKVSGTKLGSETRAFVKDVKDGLEKTPPTFTKTNEYTEGWQDVIDTYGIPRYQEANPALLAVVTFPFIFGMMYGDIGHGSLLLMAGIYLVQKGEQFKFTTPVLFTARYMVLSLGIFATFAGFMYNDFFSVSLQLFPSGFDFPSGGGLYGEYTPNTDIKNEGGKGPYPFGLDWAWAGASNELLFVNSLKMKLSVLFGVLQMIVGVLLRWSNAFYEKNLTDFIFECMPMMVFMVCFFGWMDFMILYKWTHPIDNPPSIINSLICMAMGQEDKFPIYEGSVELSKTLMMYTVLAVPLMLFPKPFVLLYKHKQEQKQKPADYISLHDEEVGASSGHGHGDHGEEFEFGEVFIHQIIETIEYVLGTVSHTASYLRIWALSLAHQQLSLVFFQKTLTMGLEMSFPANGIVLYLMFGAWFGVTLGVLLGMDVLECFLHTLRLHWVEFQSKFYRADGYKFAPFDVKELVLTAND